MRILFGRQKNLEETSSPRNRILATESQIERHHDPGKSGNLTYIAILKPWPIEFHDFPLETFVCRGFPLPY
jgi:hypothetical protein